jgi:FkbM family methyltransferase
MLSRQKTMNAQPDINLKTINGWAILPSSLKRPDAAPRFNLSFPSYFATDNGARYLVIHESGNGYEAPTRNFVERVMRRGDLFVDVGAHWGFFTLQAATHPAGEIEVISFEPELMNAVILSENVSKNKLTDAVTVVCAACGDQHDLAPLLMDSTMGHSIRSAGLHPQSGPAKWVPVITLDEALARLRNHSGRRLILKIDAEGFEPEIIAGARSLLRDGRIATIIWECGTAFIDGPRRNAMVQMVAFLSECGFRHFRKPGHEMDGPLSRFDAAPGFLGNVFSLSPLLAEDPSLDSVSA